MKSERKVRLAIEKYSDTIRRICFIHLKNYHDSEDVFQDVFLKYVLSEVEFENAEHEKAWLIRVTINACKDTVKSFFRKKVISIDDIIDNGILEFHAEENNKEILKAVFELPPKYRDIIYLFYYEGYTAVEIAKILNKNENTIYTWLSRARQKLKERLDGDIFE